MDDVEVVRSARAKRWRLEVPWGAPARLTVPERTSDRTIRRVLAERRGWIEEQRSLQVPRLGLESAAVDEHEARRAAKELVSAIADEEADALGVSFRQIRIGGQRTLWGSCSSAGTLSFNWRLALAPLSVLDYVVVHELCHLREANHSRRFWSLVESRRPGWREQRTWLRDNGQELLAFAPRGMAGPLLRH